MCWNMFYCTIPMSALLASKAVQVIYITFGPHDHLKCWNDFTARGTAPCSAKKPEFEIKNKLWYGLLGVLVLPINIELTSNSHVCTK